MNMGIRGFLFYDDTFTIDKARVMTLCDEILHRGWDISWNIRTRADTVDDPMLAALKRAGCSGINYGVESGSDRVLERLGKGITLRQVTETFHLTRKHNIPILAYFMIGNPGETLEDLHATFDAIDMLKPDYLHLSILALFPGTPLYNQAIEEGVLAGDYWREFARAPYREFTLPHWEEHFTREQLNKLIIQGYKKFYCSSTFIKRSLFKIGSMRAFAKKATAGFRLITS